MHAYLILFNHDLFFGSFATKFDLQPSPTLATTVVANTFVGLVFLVSLLTFTILLKVELNQTT